MSIFEHTNYIEVLKAILEKHKEKRGIKQIAAEFAGCHRTYLSQVLSGAAHLTADHVFGLSQGFQLTELEQAFFHKLLEHERASSRAYKKKLQKDIDQLKEKVQKVENRVHLEKSKKQIPIEYYKHWSISAIHILATCPNYQSISDLVSRLPLKESRIRESIGILEQLGYVAMVRGEKIISLEVDVFSAKGSIQEHLHAKNWRLFQMQNSGDSSLIKYTALFGLSKKDGNRIQSLILDCIKDARAIATSSREEEAYSLTIDMSEI